MSKDYLRILLVKKKIFKRLFSAFLLLFNQNFVKIVLVMYMDNNLIMCAYIRGYIISNNIIGYEELISKELIELSLEDIVLLESIGKNLGLKLYYFKEKENLARVNIVLGFLKSVYPESLLDVGSGRGVFLFPLLKEFPYLNISSIDILDRRVELLNYIRIGGISNLNVFKANICDADILDKSYDIVTLLEVLEHIPNVLDAVKNACRIAKKFVLVTVPSKEDDNPEHIHLLTKEKLTTLFNSCGVTNLKFGGVHGHLYLVARV